MPLDSAAPPPTATAPRFRTAVPVAVLLALHATVGPAARAGTVAAYMYTQTGAAGVSTLASIKPAGVGEVYLKAVDIDPQGGVHVKLDDNGRFFPAAWSSTPRPTFTCLINADPTFTWTAVDPTSSLTTGLTSNSWQQDYGGGITVDAEFSADIQSFPSAWQSCMTALRSLANGQSGGFSLYVSPKYLSTSRYPSTAAGNAAALAAILGTAPAGTANTLLFPVYDGNGGDVDGTDRRRGGRGRSTHRVPGTPTPETPPTAKRPRPPARAAATRALNSATLFSTASGGGRIDRSAVRCRPPLPRRPAP